MTYYSDIWYALAYVIVAAVLCIFAGLVLWLLADLPRATSQSWAKHRDEWKTLWELLSSDQAGSWRVGGSKEQDSETSHG